MRSSHSKEWEKAIDVEYKTLVKNDTFEWVKTVPEGRKAIGSRIVFRMKRDGNGNLIKLKARDGRKGIRAGARKGLYSNVCFRG